MTRWQHFVSAFRLRPSALIRIVKPDAMTEAQLNAALRSVPETAPYHRAIMQLLEETRDEAIEDQANDAWSPTAMAKHAGGAQYLRAVRTDILRRRAQKTPNAQRPTPNAQ